jgi:hypothetical protein
MTEALGLLQKKFGCRIHARLSRGKGAHMNAERQAVTLWRPVGPRELELIKASGMREFPPRLPEQPIFYPVTTEAYAIKIARDWNVPASGKGYVTRFRISKAFLDQYEVQLVGGKDFQEYWIPAHQLRDFNNALIGPIEVVAEFDS